MGTGPTPAGAAPTGEYWFGFHFIDLQGETWVLLNGFPVDYVIGRSTDHTIGIKLNAALIGEGNQLTVRTIPALRREAQRLQVSPVQYCGRVVGSYNRPVSGGKMAAARVDSAYAAWQEALNPVWTSVLQAEAASELGSASAIDAMRDSVAAQPFELAATFDNERGPDFSYLFEEAPVIDGTAADRARLRDYAVDLVNMFVQKDTNAVYNEVSIELRDADFTPTQARQLVASDWLSFSWRKISKEDVGLRAWSGGRVWELYRKPSGDPLLVAGREYQNGLLEVYVAQIDGELKVVR